MIIVIHPEATMDDIESILSTVQKIGLEFSIVRKNNKTIILTQPSYDINADFFKSFPKVEYVVSLNEDFKLVYKNINNLETIIDFGDGLKIGGEEIAVIAGPCAVENAEQLFRIASSVKKSGAKFLRGGSFKFRTDPYSFQGLGIDGLRLLKEAKEMFGLKIVTEVLDYHDFEKISEVADIIQIGARNMHNINLLKEAGKTDKPILLKRSYSSTLKEFLFAAEYILIGGNKNVILCERGIRTFSDFSRNTLDLSIVPAIKQRCHLPVIVDPSHATGNRDYVLSMSLAAIAAGADGIMVEVHHQPELAYSDSNQSIRLEQFDELMKKLVKISSAVGRKLTLH